MIVCLFIGSRLLYLLQQSSSSLELRTECAVVLGSLAMGTENNIKSLVDCHIIPALLQGWGTHILSHMQILTAEDNSLGDLLGDTDLNNTCVFLLTGLLCPDLIFIEACLRCLRTVFISPVTPVQLLYTVGCLVHVLPAVHMSNNVILDLTFLISKHTECRLPFSVFMKLAI